MPIETLRVTELIPAWKNVLDIAEVVPPESWALVGGLMTQAHAELNGLASRATSDVDMLIDVLSSAGNVAAVVRALEKLEFEPQEPGLRGSAFHRMKQGDMIIDILVADHLPSGKQKSASYNRWPALATPGGAQALERREQIEVASASRKVTIYMPNLLGALVLKCAAYTADKRDAHRHLEDVALLASLIDDHAAVLDQLHGSDKKRLRIAANALADVNEPAWLLLPLDWRIKGQDTMRILSV